MCFVCSFPHKQDSKLLWNRDWFTYLKTTVLNKLLAHSFVQNKWTGPKTIHSVHRPRTRTHLDSQSNANFMSLLLPKGPISPYSFSVPWWVESKVTIHYLSIIPQIYHTALSTWRNELYSHLLGEESWLHIGKADLQWTKNSIINAYLLLPTWLLGYGSTWCFLTFLPPFFPCAGPEKNDTLNFPC